MPLDTTACKYAAIHNTKCKISMTCVEVLIVIMKLFKTTDMQVVKMCREHFDFVLPSLQLDRRRRSFVGSPFTTDLIKFVFA